MPPLSDKRRIKTPVILGPTASGKTELAIQLAKDLGSEIISCDSRQVYRFMNIGTAKPTATEQQLVKHWMVDIIEPDQSFSCFKFAYKAEEIIRGGDAFGKFYFICGGSGLYFKSLGEGIGPSGKPNNEFRKKYWEKARVQGNQSIFEELSGVDPLTASLSSALNVQRNIRALEVFYETGIPLSEHKARAHPPSGIDFFVMVTVLPRPLLYERINKRVDAMAENGLFEEFKSLRRRGYDEHSPGMQCLGYKELFAVEKGIMSFKNAIEMIKLNTRRYAKRQVTWFRHQTRIDAILTENESIERVKKMIITFLRL